jgi:hypothetical protein
MTQRRLGTNGWLLVTAGLLLAIIAGDYVRATLAEQSRVVTPPPKSPYQPAFSEGRAGPDFELPDGKGRLRRLSELARSEALLSFVSDDAPSRALMRYAARLAQRRRKAGKPLPAFIAVADFPPARERGFLAETGLQQVVLYEAKDGPVSQQFRAGARPRCFQFASKLGVAVIGSSPADAPLFEIGKEILQGWRLRSPSMAGFDFEAPEPDELRGVGVRR